jgi:aminoglycoside 2'-N-acetyltransferase I
MCSCLITWCKNSADRAGRRAWPAKMACVAELRTAHTADLDAADLKAARALLDEVFLGEMTDADWEHGLGGMHALVWDGPALIGHGSVVQRRILHQGRALRAGYVEAVAVRADRQREGHGGALMGALERVLRGAYDLGALGSTDEGARFYAARGWKLWQGPSSALTPAGIRPTPDEDGCLFVFELAVPLDLSGELTCDWRDGDVW